uniref:Uncharacterized protein n=1 Tax=Romanomermis culicivorax TaxID=13658 RepID=A0A915HM02_ROMCU
MGNIGRGVILGAENCSLDVCVQLPPLLVKMSTHSREPEFLANHKGGRPSSSNALTSACVIGALPTAHATCKGVRRSVGLKTINNIRNGPDLVAHERHKKIKLSAPKGSVILHREDAAPLVLFILKSGAAWEIIFIKSFCGALEFLALVNITFCIWKMIRTSSAWEECQAPEIFKSENDVFIVFQWELRKITFQNAWKTLNEARE